MWGIQRTYSRARPPRARPSPGGVSLSLSILPASIGACRHGDYAGFELASSGAPGALLGGGFYAGEAAVGGLYAGDEALAGGEAEEEGCDAKEDGHGAEPPGAEKVAQDAEGRTDGARRDARASPEQGGGDAAYAQ